MDVPKTTAVETDKRMSAMMWLILCAIVLWSVYASFHNTGHGFENDEFYHALAARSYLRDGSLRLAPGLREYTRSRLTTLLVAASFRVFGESEAAARIPSGVFACLGVMLAFVAGRSFFGSSAGLWAAGITAFMPIFIEHGRTTRMYAHSWFFTLLTAFLFFHVCAGIYECSREDAGAWRRFRRWILSLRGWGLVLVLAVAAALMIHLHLVSLALFPGIAAYVLYLLVSYARRLGVSRAVRSPLCAISVAGALLALTGILASGRGFGLLTAPFASIAQWAEGVDESPMRYHNALRDQGLLLYGLFPLSLLLVWVRGRRAGVYCSFVFLTALGFLLVFRWKEPRYLAVHLGTYALLCAVAADTVFRLLREEFSSLLGGRLRGAGFAAVAVAGAIIATGVPQTALWCVRAGGRSDDRDALEYVRRHWEEGDAVATLLPTSALYYLGRADYVLEIVDRKDKDVAHSIIGSASELAAAEKSSRQLWVVINALHVEGTHRLRLIATEVAQELRKLTPVYASARDGMRVYRIRGSADGPQ